MARDPGLAGSGTASSLGKGREEGHIDMMVIHTLENLQVGWEKTGRAMLCRLIIQRGSKKLQKAHERSCEFSSFEQLKITDHANLLINLRNPILYIG